jgi:RHS repeat-associated protein
MLLLFGLTALQDASAQAVFSNLAVNPANGTVASTGTLTVTATGNTSAAYGGSAVRQVDLMEGSTVLASQSFSVNYNIKTGYLINTSRTINLSAGVAAGTHVLRLRSYVWTDIGDGIEDAGYSDSQGFTVTAAGAAQVNGATYVSQSVPSTMVAGQSYSVSITMRNSGTTTWGVGGANPYGLGSQNAENNTTWGLGRIAVDSPVAPGSSKTFSFTVTAPNTAGTYNFQWRMLQEYKEWFGDFAPNIAVQVSVPQPSASFVSPADGSTYTASGGTSAVTFSGSAAPGTGATLTNVQLLEGGVAFASGTSSAITGSKALSVGAHTIELRVTDSRNQVASAYRTVTVNSPPTVNGATYVSQSVPSTMVAGQSYSVSVTMRNSGTTTWGVGGANPYGLGSQNAENNTIWGPNRIAVDSPVAPGSSKTFSFTVTAPNTAGTYNFQWRMVQEYKEWFGDFAPNIAVQVSVPQPSAGFVSPADGSTYTASGGTSTVTFSGSAAPGAGATLTNVQLLENGVAFASGTSSAITGSKALSAGTHTIELRVTDSRNQVASAYRAVTVNAPPPASTGIPTPPKSATRSTAFQYEPGTLLQTQVIIEPGSAQLQLKATSAFDAWGNKTSSTVSSPATGNAAIESRVTSMRFDSTGTFAVGYTDPSGHGENRSYDPRHGQVTSRQDVQNGISVLTTSDTFGRKTMETAADGTKTRWDYSYCSGVNGGTASCPTYAKYIVQTTPVAADGVTARGAWTRAYFDALDREVQTESLGFDGSSVAVVSTEYNALGQLYRVSRPYFKGQAVSWSERYYDEVGRITSTTNPSSSVSYSGLSVVFTDALTHSVTKVLNSRGEPIRITDPANNAIAYFYDPFGNVWKTVDPQGNEVGFVYDIRGNKTQMYDPDMGVTTSEYDAAGNEVKRTNANQQVTTWTFDKLNRVLTRSEPEMVSTWTYDSCAKGYGRLCTTTATNGFEQTTGYDTFGRASTLSTKIDAVYNQSATFDGDGRLATETYPNGLVIKYGYGPTGSLSEIRNNATNALYWSANSVDAAGNLLKQTFGNNVSTDQAFDSVTGRLRYVYAGVNNSVQNLVFGYDDIGNLKTRNDVNQNFTETFLYDDRNRLTSATVNSSGAGVVTQTFTYDSIGNIKSRSDVGTYTYGLTNNRPHAVDSVDWTGVGKRKFYYDNNGNLTEEIQLDSAGNTIAGKGRKASYTSFNMPSSLSTPSATVGFMYDAYHARIKETSPAGTTIFVHPDNSGGLGYEKEIKSDGTVEHRNFITAAGQVVAVVKQVGAASSVRYFHRDYQGSVTAISDEAGTVIERLAYEPFGKRRYASGAPDTTDSIKGVNTTRGYTGHEHLDAIGLIHMNGRVFNPLLSRFLSPDPGVPYAEDLQSFNRYSYTRNNPLSYDDPSGFDDAMSGQGGSMSTVQVSGQRGLDDEVVPYGNMFIGSSYSTVSTMTQQSDAPKQVTYSRKSFKVETGFANNGTPVNRYTDTWGKDIFPRVYASPDQLMMQWISFNPIEEIARSMGANERQAFWVGIAGSMISNPKQLLAEGVKKATFSQIRKVLVSAQAPYKGSTVIGHALSKHSGRHPEIWGKITGSMKTWNDQAMVHLREISRAPGEFQEVSTEGIRFLEKRLEDGRGIRLNMDGTFKGFLD